MRETMEKLQDQYTSALRNSIVGMGESALQQAYELGRRALADGLGVLDMATIYHKALAAVLSRATTPEEKTLTLRAGASFFVESLSPFEMTHRGFRETNTTLRRLNQMHISQNLTDSFPSRLTDLRETLSVVPGHCLYVVA